MTEGESMTAARGKVTIGAIAVIIALAAFASLAHSVQKERAKTSGASLAAEGGHCGADGGGCATGGGCGGHASAPPFANKGPEDAEFSVYIGAPIGPTPDAQSSETISAFLRLAASYPDDLRVTVRPAQHPELSEAGITEPGVWFVRDGVDAPAELKLLGGFADDSAKLIASVTSTLTEAGIEATDTPEAAEPAAAGCPAEAAKAARHHEAAAASSDSGCAFHGAAKDAEKHTTNDEATCEDAAGCSGESCDDACPIHGKVAEQV